MRRDTCTLGHPLVEENLIPSLMRSGKKSCLACSRARNQNRKFGFEVESDYFKTLADRCLDEILPRPSELERLSVALRDLEAAKSYQTPVDDHPGGDPISFGPADPIDNFDALSLEDEVERKLGRAAVEIFGRGPRPARGRDLAKWLEQRAQGPDLDHLNELASELATKVESYLAQLYRSIEVTDQQVNNIVERFEHVDAVVPVQGAAKLLSDFFSQEITVSMVRRAAKDHFGLVTRNGQEEVSVKSAIRHFHRRK